MTSFGDTLTARVIVTPLSFNAMLDMVFLQPVSVAMETPILPPSVLSGTRCTDLRSPCTRHLSHKPMQHQIAMRGALLCVSEAHFHSSRLHRTTSDDGHRNSETRCPIAVLHPIPPCSDASSGAIMMSAYPCVVDDRRQQTPYANHDNSGLHPFLDDAGQACCDLSQAWIPSPWTCGPRPPSFVGEGCPLPLPHAGAVYAPRLLVTKHPTCVSSTTPVNIPGLAPVDVDRLVLRTPIHQHPQQYPPALLCPLSSLQVVGFL